MDFQRLLLVAALSFTLFLIWEAWQEDYGPKPAAPVPQATAPGGSAAPATPGADLPVPAAGAPAAAEAPATPGLNSAQRISVVTDVVRAELDTYGGDLRQLELLAYPVSNEDPTPTMLLRDKGEVFVAQTGLLPAGAGGVAPDHHAIFTAEQPRYELQPGQDTLAVRLQWSGNGLAVTKIYTFHRGSYVVDVAYEVRNGGAGDWRGHAYQQWLRSEPPAQSAFFASTYTGGVIHGEENKYEKVGFDDMREAALSKDLKGAWAAMIQHYFLGAWIPAADTVQHAYSKVLGDNRYILGLVGPELVVGPGQSVTLPSRMYVGPKLQSALEQVAPGLELTVDYGWLTFIAKPLWWLLELSHKLLGNWGWAIIALTVLIKLAFYKLSETSYRSMAHMRKVQPKMLAIKERFEGDREKMNEAMMKLYREEKINPLGGCLPILVQIPVFIALYWVLLDTVELRQAPWILWIDDLSTMDPYYVLPIVMGLSMLVQQKLNPTPMDPIQAKVFMILPVVFTVFFIWFPAGLVLYWVVNNLLSIAQQWYITRKIEKA